jgi:hypothetical protein
VMSSPADSHSPEPGTTVPEAPSEGLSAAPITTGPAAPEEEDQQPVPAPVSEPAVSKPAVSKPAVSEPSVSEVQPELDVAPDSELVTAPEPELESQPEPHLDSHPEPRPIEINAGPFQLGETTDDERSHEAANGRKVRRVLLGGLLVVIVAGVATLGYVGWQVNTQRHTTLSVPSTIGTLSLDDGEDAAATADYLRSAISAEITMDKAVGAVYTSSDDKSVLFFGGTRLLWSPDSELESAFTLLGDEEGTVGEIRDVDAGELGGTMQCGVTKSDGTDLQVCGWADHGSLAVAMFLDRTPTEAAGLMKDIRAATQTRG